MKERNVRFITIREEFNEYEIENGLFYLRIKPVLTEITEEIREEKSGFNFNFTPVVRVIKLVERNTSDSKLSSSEEVAKENNQRELQFKPLKEIINLYETGDGQIILVAYILEKVFSKNGLDKEGIPIMGFMEYTLVNVVPKPDTSKID
jgi:hypothetical protein